MAGHEMGSEAAFEAGSVAICTGFGAAAGIEGFGAGV
jgi:hypothetical protein